MANLDITLDGNLTTMTGVDKTLDRMYITDAGTGGLQDIAPKTLLPDFRGFAENYSLAVSVSSNNLTVALKTAGGNDPSEASPVKAWIGGNQVFITSALSVTVNAGANTFNAGGTELANKEIDYFVYLGYVSGSSTVSLLVSRIPYARLYSEFSGTATNEKYAAYSTVPASTDSVINIGRCAATNSGSASYNWTVPTFTHLNLVNQPIFNTRILSWQPVYSGSGSLTYTSVTTDIAEYQIVGNILFFEFEAHGTTGGTTNATLLATLPFESRNVAQQAAVTAWVLDTGSAGIAAFAYMDASTPDRLAFRRYDSANWSLGANRYINGNGKYFI